MILTARPLLSGVSRPAALPLAAAPSLLAERESTPE